MRRRFFVDRFDSNSATLTGDAAEHLGRVLRAEPGQLYELSDGNSVWLGRVERVALSKRGDNHIDFALVEHIPAREPWLHLNLLLSIVKFDRFEWCLEKATELGVTEIVPLAAAHTEKRLLEAAGKRQPRWEKILLESAQQSRRLRPALLRSGGGGGTARKNAARNAAMRPAEAFAQSSGALKIIFSERRDARPLRDALKGARGTSATLAIGPEGGWSDDEIAAARAAGFLEVSLGENILRTETAVLAALAILRFALSTE
ncbi:MAG: RsmE family RNA methyltransferase [Candidatus Acidiferrales bacterium]